MSSFEYRVGSGFDLHPLAPHEPGRPSSRRHLHLCGVKVPCDYRAVGHSDADAGLHAIVDAILGAIGAADIGQHFPADDPKWQGANSDRFLLHAYRLLKEKGGEIVNIDVTIITEIPRVSPHRETMVKHIASVLKISANRVSVKATTMEKKGFIGRGEAIAAQAVVMVKLPVGDENA